MWSNGFQIAGGGTSFPDSPTENDIYFRTDLQSLYGRLGGKWLALGGPPIGSIVAWSSFVAGTPTYPENWVPCDGGTIGDHDSPMYGYSVPNLNGSGVSAQDGYFLRGAGSTPVGSGTKQPDAVKDHQHGFTNAAYSVSPASHQHSVTMANHQHNISTTSGTNSSTAVSAVGNNTSGNTGYVKGTLPVMISSSTSLSVALASGGSVGNMSSGGGSSETRPQNFAVTWIMRIK